MNSSSKSNEPCLFGWIAFAFSAAVLFANILFPGNSGPVIKVTGVAILFLSAPFMFAPFLYLKKHGGVPEGKAYYETTLVVEAGPYRLIRHPQYLGYILLVVGFALLSANPFMTAPTLLAILFFYLQAAAEEKQCLRAFGPRYRDYAARVPRFNILLGTFWLLRNRS